MIAVSLVYAVVVYLIASIPFALILGKVFHHVDIRDYGDGNPGATNLKRATDSLAWYMLAILLDGFKALFPIGIPYWFFGWTGAEIIPVAIAALCGHAFSVFLNFNGGKVIATTGGVWVGLIVFEAVLVIPVTLVFWFFAVEENEWQVVLMMLSLLAYVFYTRRSDTVLYAIWLFNFALIVYKHRAGLNKPPTLKRPNSTAMLSMI